MLRDCVSIRSIVGVNLFWKCGLEERKGFGEPLSKQPSFCGYSDCVFYIMVTKPVTNQVIGLFLVVQSRGILVCSS